jgi:hypothetical protein
MHVFIGVKQTSLKTMLQVQHSHTGEGAGVCCENVIDKPNILSRIEHREATSEHIASMAAPLFQRCPQERHIHTSAWTNV